MNYLLENALKHSNVCRELLEQGRLADALRYCTNQRIEPPQGLSAAEAANADRMRTLADFGWWSKRLKILAARDTIHIRSRASKSAAS
ncbi:MAG: hypothetical protein V4724_28595 [Pseudomonadota bacterium]